MNVQYLYPEDIGLCQLSDGWRKLCARFGYTEAPPSILLAEIKVFNANGLEI